MIKVHSNKYVIDLLMIKRKGFGGLELNFFVLGPVFVHCFIFIVCFFYRKNVSDVLFFFF